MATPRDLAPRISIIGPVGTPLSATLEMLVSESHTLASETTEHAVERGADITDHVRRKPDVVTFQVFVSEEPLDGLTNTTFTIPLPTNVPQTIEVGGTSVTIPAQDNKPSLLTPGGLFGAATGAITDLLTAPKTYSATVGIPTSKSYVGEFLSVLESYRGELVTIFTTKRTYDNMLLETVTMDRGQADGTGARMSLSFKQVRIVDTKIVPAPAGPPAAKSLVNKGAQTAPERKKPIDNESVISALRAGRLLR